jgi:PIN domain nuclease of toxin-antitoxin system
MSEGVLLDTCAAIWWAEGAEISADSKRRIDNEAAKSRIFLSPFIAWEAALIQARGRKPSIPSVDEWYQALLALQGFREAALAAHVLTAAWRLPGGFHNDPADRIMIATAREYGLTLITRDRAILEYGAMGHADVLAC